MSGDFLGYWDSHGGLLRFGYPISDQIEEQSGTEGKTYAVQYFERAVLELHPENQPPYEVLLQLLGTFRYAELYRNSAGAPNQYANNDAGAVTFPQTGKTLGYRFLDYWTTHGGLAQFGYPISDEFLEISPVDGESYQVQYFERAEFEYHPYNLKPYEVLLSQLGTLRWQDNHEAQNPLKPEFRSEIPDGEYLPLYPGAVIKSIYGESVTERLVRYEAPASENSVRAFYARVLPKSGWTYLDSIGDPEYEWTDPKGLMPWHLSLHLLISKGDAGAGISEVQFNYSRYPDASKTPLYPDAQDISVNKVAPGGPPFPASCSDTITTTTYRTGATPAEVDAFYQTTLVPYGWKRVEGAGSIDSAKGLRFLSDHNVNAVRTRQGVVFTSERLDLSISAHTDVATEGLTGITLSLHTCMYDESGE